MDVSQNISTDANANLVKALPYQPTHVRAIDYVIITVSCLGIVGNLVSLAVWSTHPTYNPFVFLFKYLAVVDIQDLVSSLSWRIFIFFRRYVSAYTFFTVAFTLYATEVFGQALSIHTTLLIAVCRFFVVSRPLQVYNGSLLTRRQIIVVCAVLFLWCLLITTPFVVIVLLVLHDKLQVSYYFTFGIIFLALSFASLLMVIFEVLLVKKLGSSSALRSSICSTQCQRPGGSRRAQRVTTVVLLMSLCAILAYLVTGTSIGLINMYFFFCKKRSESGHYNATYIIVPVYELLQALNSSINIVFYFAFFRSFRRVFPTDKTETQVKESSAQTRITMNKNASDGIRW